MLVMLPTYNERGNVRKMVDQIFALGLPTDILFIDDNSPDGTGIILDEMAESRKHKTVSQIFVIHRSGKKGIGSAHKEGILWAYSWGYTTLITMDSDFLHSPSDIPELVKCSETAEVVVTSRFVLKDSLSEWQVYRKIITKTGHFLTGLLLGMPYDATGAFRLYKLDKIPIRIFQMVESRGYPFFFESLAILNLNGVRITEVPVKLKIRTYGDSKLTVKDLWQSVTFMAKLAWRIHMHTGKITLEG